MSISNFTFLQDEWPELHTSARQAEALVAADPRSASFYARRTLELAAQWLYAHDAALTPPYQDHLSALLYEPTFRDILGPTIFAKARLIKDLGNQAVHSNRPVRPADALTAVKELFHLLFWIARTYAVGTRPTDTLTFDPARVPQTVITHATTLAQVQTLAAEVQARDAQLAALQADHAALDTALQQLRAEVAAAKVQNTATPDAHDYSEAETRDVFIDLLLREAGWALDAPQDREYEVRGMPNPTGLGYVDYVLWGDDGLPLAVVEAKRTRRDAHAGQQQAKLYADCLQTQFGRRPVIFYTNGYEHWLWDDAQYPPRAVQGFYTKDQLALLLQRRTTRKSLASAPIDDAIVERYYQQRAIRRISEAFERDHDRKALLVMATGAGKTRTVIALCDVLMRCNWAKRILFLADRTALVRQAVNAFKKHLPDASPVNLLEDKESEGRVFVSTYPTMMGLIDDTRDGQRRFGPGHFDLIIIDEAHRSVYQKYRAIFEYFDSLLVGLTATPRDEVDRDTYGLFDLEQGVSTDAYDLSEAVRDGYLVPAQAVSVPLRFPREGIRYDELSDDEKEQWEEKDWDEDGTVPDRVEAAAVNAWLFNADTVDQVLAHLMTRGLHVKGGDQLGKTIIFAKNHAHAEFIAQRFNVHYPHYRGDFARVIDVKVDYAQTLIETFSHLEKPPHIAISVDMLDTGIDIPEVVNLVFFKLVRSKTKFWQMVGRGTRLCANLFGPGMDKAHFFIFDYCQNLEFFSQNPETTDGALAASLGTRLFRARLELLAALDGRAGGTADRVGEDKPAYLTENALRRDTADLLRREVAAMNVANFVVRPQRRLVEQFAQPEAWAVLSTDDHIELSRNIAGLPAELAAEDEEAKRFDYLLLRLQLALLHAEPTYTRLCTQLREIAGLLEEKADIPMVREQLALIQDLQTDEWWQDVTVPMLETVRRRLRALVKLLDKRQRKVVYTDFEDEMGEETPVALPGFTAPDNFERFRAKARHFLQAHEDSPAVRKLRQNEPLMPGDLADLEHLLVDGGIGTMTDVQRAAEISHGLGLFVRSLVGLDRDAAHRAFATFYGKPLTPNQSELLTLITDHLEEHGVMASRLLYESPYTDMNPLGVEGIFTGPDIDSLFGILAEIGSRAECVAA